MRSGAGPLLSGARETSYFTLEYTDGIPGVSQRFDDHRWIVGEGTRLEVLPSGTTRTSKDILPKSPQFKAMIPPHLGHGFLFVVDSRVFRSDEWTGEAKLTAQLPSNVSALYTGLDRFYLRDASDKVHAINGEGALTEASGWPSAPYVSGYFAIDAWRAIVSGDVIGSIVTFDGGRSWTRLEPSLLPSRALSVDGRFFVQASLSGRVGKPENSKPAIASWYEVSQGGSVEARPAPPGLSAQVAASTPKRSPLGAAVEGGFPMEDGTILYIDEGAATRIRESDGAILARGVPHPQLRDASCQGTLVGAGVGFVCNGGQATSIVSAHPNGNIELLRSFDGKRKVHGSGNGSLVISGPCKEDAGETNRFCVLHRGGRFQDVALSQATGRELLVARKDESLAVLRPPNEESDGAVVVYDHGKVTAHPISLDGCSSAKFDPRSAVWLDGFEERGHALGGWLLAEQKYVSVELETNGAISRCDEQPVVGPTVVAGRFGFTWLNGAASQTTDGGKIWSSIRAPIRAKEDGREHRRSCGEAGCVGFGWIRTGWATDPEKAAVSASSAPPPITPNLATSASFPRLDFDCSLVASSSLATPATGAPKLASGKADPTKSPQLAFFGAMPVFKAPAPERIDLLDIRSAGSVSGRVYSWAEDSLITTTTYWLASWVDAFGRSSQVFATDRGVAPQAVSENPSPVFVGGSGRTGAFNRGNPLTLRLELDEDPRFGMLFLRAGRGNTDGETSVAVVQERAAPLLVTRADRDPFRNVDSAVRLAGTWYVAASETFEKRTGTTTIYRIDGATARPIAVLPREFQGSAVIQKEVRFATSSEGHTLGIIIEAGAKVAGESDYWLVSLDVETGRVDLPARLPFAVSSPARACADGEEGLRFELPYPKPVSLRHGGEAETISSPTIRWKSTALGLCVDALRGTHYRPWHHAKETLGTRARFPARLLGSGESATLVCSPRG